TCTVPGPTIRRPVRRTGRRRTRSCVRLRLVVNPSMACLLQRSHHHHSPLTTLHRMLSSAVARLRGKESLLLYGSLRMLLKCDHHSRTGARFVALLSLFTLSLGARADDWPQWLGPQRDGVWRETGIIQKFPENGPTVRWRTPIAAGYTGPAVANGRVFVMDRVGAAQP